MPAGTIGGRLSAAYAPHTHPDAARQETIMSRTVTALFDSRSDAEAAKQRLQQSRIDADNIAIHDKSSSGFNENSYSSSSDPGDVGSIKNAFLPDEDRHTYEEGVRRGGVLLTATSTRLASTTRSACSKNRARSTSRIAASSGARPAGLHARPRPHVDARCGAERSPQ
jgi:hypothetical protein